MVLHTFEQFKLRNRWRCFCVAIVVGAAGDVVVGAARGAERGG